MIVDGRYRIDREIHSGHKTVIYRGIDLTDQSPVVIKAPSSEFPSLPEIERIEEEYRLGGELQDIPGVVKMHSLINYKNGKAIVMEDIGGMSLDMIIGGRPLAVDMILLVLDAVGGILEALHDQGVIYKDMKPHNVVMNPVNNEIRLIDFGLSSRVKREDLSGLRSFGGTAAYLSPELTGCMNRGVDYRTDMYSLGVMFFEMLTGKLPFESHDQNELVYAHIARLPPLPSEKAVAVPMVFDEMVCKLMQKNAEDRYQSMAALVADLRHARKLLAETGSIPLFPIGTRDVSRYFAIPEKLYGREKELLELMLYFQNAAGGGKEAVIVHGPAGMGKTMFVNELYRPITGQRGFFIRGCFERMKMNVPYSGIIQACDALVRQVLMERDDEIRVWKNKIAKAVAGNGRIITDMIPLAEHIMGPQAVVPELDHQRSHNRFINTLTGFMNVFADRNRPLVLCIENLQWADEASMYVLVSLLTDPASGGLLFIGTLRDNEPGTDYAQVDRFSLDLEKSGMAFRDLALPPLGKDAIISLLVDALKQKGAEINQLAGLLEKKTAGNPLFINMLLTDLYLSRLLEHDGAAWAIDEAGINRIAVTENVAQRLEGRLRGLSAETLELVKAASCFSGRIFPDMMPELLGKPEESVSASLAEAFHEGLFIREESTDSHDRNIVFSHERIREAAYSMLTETEKSGYHFRLGQLLLSRLPESARDRHLFLITNQFNLCHVRLDDSQKLMVLDLNVRAAKKARSSAAFEAAVGFLRAARELLPGRPWESAYHIALEVHAELAECEYLSGRYAEADAVIDCVLGHSREKLDTAHIMVVRINMYAAQNRIREAFELGRQCLLNLGYKIPKKATRLSVLIEISRIRIKLRKKTEEDILAMGVADNGKSAAALMILAALGEPTYQSYPDLAPLVILKGLSISLEKGFAASTPMLFAYYGVVLCVLLGDNDQGMRMLDAAIALTTRLDAKQVIAKIMILYSFANHYRNHPRNALPFLEEGASSGMSYGDFQYASYCINHQVIHHLFTGTNLAKLDELVHELSVKQKKMAQPDSLIFFNILHEAVHCLGNGHSSSTVITGTEFDESAQIPALVDDNLYTTLAGYYVCKLFLLYLFGEHETGLKLADEGIRSMQGAFGQLVVTQFYFIHALLISSAARRKGERRMFRALARYLEMFRKLAGKGAAAYLHKYILLKAEAMPYNRRSLERIALYEAAIRHAHENGFVAEEAMICECAALFCLRTGNEKRAADFLFMSRYNYEKWGCAPKVIMLNETYSALLRESAYAH